jgi:outer membrane protein
MKNLAISFALLISSSALATSLSEALISAYQNNPDLIAERENLKKTDEKMSQAIANFLPTVKYSATKRYDKKDSHSSNSEVEKVSPWMKHKSKNSSLQIDQNVFSGGQSIMAVKMAKYTIEAGRTDLIKKEQEIFSNTIDAYFEVMKAKNILEINKNNYQSYAKKYDSIKEEVEAGVKRKTDLAQAQSSKSNAQTQLSIADSNYQSALANYFKITSIVANNINMNVGLGNLPKSQEELLQASLKENPALLNAQYLYKVAEINTLSNVAELLPKINIGGSIDKSWTHTQGTDLVQPYQNSKNTYIELNVPIYSQGLEYSNVRGSKADAESKKYNAKNTQAQIISDVTKEWTNYKAAQQSLISAEEAVKAGIISVDGMQQSYDEGVSSIGELIDSQEALFRYQITLETVKKDLQIARYNIIALMGKLTAKDLGLSTKIYNPVVNYDKVKLQIIGF